MQKTVEPSNKVEAVMADRWRDACMRVGEMVITQAKLQQEVDRIAAQIDLAVAHGLALDGAVPFAREVEEALTQDGASS